MANTSENDLVQAMKGGVSALNPLAGQHLMAESTPNVRDRSLAERIVILSLFLDAIVVAVALVLSFWIRFDTVFSNLGILSAVTFRDYLGYLVIGFVTMLFVLAYRQFYTRSVVLRYRRVARLILECSLIWFLGFLSISLALKFQPPISRLYTGIAAATICVFLLVWRRIFDRIVHSSQLVSSLRQRVVFVGWNSESERLSHAFASDVSLAYELVGCVTPMGRELASEPRDARLLLGSEENLADLIEERRIDIVMHADMNAPQADILGLANLCEKMMVQFKVVPSYFQILVSGLHLETVSGIPILGVSRLPLDRSANIVLKRAVDLVGSVVGLILTLPLILFFGAIVWIESPGPILYRQRRLGRNGREFFIFKIRSMRLDAEANGKVGWSTKDDPRRLRVGSFMRKWNIDEVPQFWNVLKGEMSLVGPRPERPELIRNFKEEIPHYNARHNVKPGITGWAQVKGFRGDTDLGERIKCDLFYLENWNLLLDFQIMVMTFLKRENAC